MSWSFEEGQQVVLADAHWLLPQSRKGKLFASGHEVAVERPSQDKSSAPTPDCHEHSYEYDPDEHEWCCRSHAVAEAEWSDKLAVKRAAGELNPEAWPPVVDEDKFDTALDGSATADSVEVSTEDGPPEGLTIDDLD